MISEVGTQRRHCLGCWIDISQSQGKTKRCPECKKKEQHAIHKRYRMANPDKIAARNRKYRKENPEKVAAANKRWQQANPENVAAGHMRWQQANPEKIAAYNKKWREKIVAEKKKQKEKVYNDWAKIMQEARMTEREGHEI